MRPEGLIEVARVARAHGIRGELGLALQGGSPELFAPGETLFLRPRGGRERPRPYAVVASRGGSGRTLLVALEGVIDRNAAEALRGAEIYVPEAVLPPPPENEEYLYRLVGARVFLVDGAEAGVFESILDTPGQLTFVIRGPGGEEILFPAAPEFIRELDAAAGRIVIDPPPGLMELYLRPSGGSSEGGE